LLLAQSFAGPEASWAFGKAYRDSFRRQLSFIVSKKPAYAWGGSACIEQGLDCSGYLFLAAKWAGIPGITRTTAHRMSLGLGGWASRSEKSADAQECDLVFWTFSTARPNGHVGAFLGTHAGGHKVTHASTNRGVIFEPLTASLRKNLTSVRRLTIGD
jgi:cell wall-associated NlpC family hydrolase